MTQFLVRCSLFQAPKKDKKDSDEEDAAFKAKKKAEAEALKAARDKGTITTRSLQAITDI
jgi:translation machinery associated TMA7 protein